MLLYQLGLLVILMCSKEIRADDAELQEYKKQVAMFIAAGSNLLLKKRIMDLRQNNDGAQINPNQIEELYQALAANLMLKNNVNNIKIPQQQTTIESNFDIDSDPNPNPSSCAEALPQDQPDGVYTLKLSSFPNLQPFDVYCMQDRRGDSAWTVILRRQNGRADFYRNWNKYKKGFGILYDEFFIGLEKLHALTMHENQELWIQMEDFHNKKAFAKYDLFAIGDEISKYALTVLGHYSGNAGDALRIHHSGMKFSTKDQNNGNQDHESCAIFYKGAWWYNDDGEHCYGSHLTGPYLGQNESSNQGIYWDTWRPDETLKYVHMAIRPIQ